MNKTIITPSIQDIIKPDESDVFIKSFMDSFYKTNEVNTKTIKTELESKDFKSLNNNDILKNGENEISSFNSIEQTSYKSFKKAPFIQCNGSKPTLNIKSSRNKLYDYSCSKEFLEDKETYERISKMFYKNTMNCIPEEDEKSQKTTTEKAQRKYNTTIKKNYKMEEAEFLEDNENIDINIEQNKNKNKENIEIKESNEVKEIKEIKEADISLSKGNNNQNENQENAIPQGLTDYEQLLYYQQQHLPVPISRKDDEKFKLLKMKQMRRVSLPSNRSVRKIGELTPEYEKNFKNNMDYSAIKKRKVCHSTRKIYISTLTTLKNNGEKIEFPLFLDQDIGVYEYWQAHIRESKADEDVDSDAEQIIVAASFCITEIKEAFDYLRKNGIAAINNLPYNPTLGK